jgi:hypothetical protein
MGLDRLNAGVVASGQFAAQTGNRQLFTPISRTETRQTRKIGLPLSHRGGRMSLMAGKLLLPAVLVVFLQPAKTQSPTLLMPAALLAQSQSQPQASPTPAPQDKADVNSKIESNLNSVFSGDPVLQGADISASVDDVAITLTGAVQSEGQHQRALALVSQYTQYRKIVDKITTK